MNKQTLYVVLAVVAVGAVGYWLYKRNQTTIVQQPPSTRAPENPSNNGGSNVNQYIEIGREAWDELNNLWNANRV